MIARLAVRLRVVTQRRDEYATPSRRRATSDSFKAPSRNVRAHKHIVVARTDQCLQFLNSTHAGTGFNSFPSP